MLRLLSIADLVTLLNVVLGFCSLLMTFSGHLQLAASFILLGLLADGLDGIIARRLGNGRLGEQLEPIADMVSLSVAPLLLVYMMYYETVVSQLPLYLLLAGVLVFSLLCSIIRLSSFSLLKKEHWFVGLPTSVSAIFLVLATYLRLEVWVVLPCVILLSLAMVSSVRFPKPGLKVNLVIAVFVVFVIMLDSRYNNIAPLLLLAGLACYIFLGPVFLRLKTRDGVIGTTETRS